MANHPRLHDTRFLGPCKVGHMIRVPVKVLGHGFERLHDVRVLDPNNVFTWTRASAPTHNNEGDMDAVFTIDGPIVETDDGTRLDIDDDEVRTTTGEVNVTVGTAPYAASAPFTVTYVA